MAENLQTYDPKQVSCIMGGQIADGFSDGSFITAERNSDSASFKKGSRGGGTRVLSRDKSGTIVLKFQQTSPSNAFLSAQLADLENNGGGLFSIFIKDASGNDVIIAASCWVRKATKMEFANDLSDREWTIETDELEIVAAGQAA